jgi:hypothetical protein
MALLRKLRKTGYSQGRAFPLYSKLISAFSVAPSSSCHPLVPSPSIFYFSLSGIDVTDEQTAAPWPMHDALIPYLRDHG